MMIIEKMLVKADIYLFIKQIIEINRELNMKTQIYF